MIKSLTFPPLPLIYIYIEYDYQSTKTFEDMIELYYIWKAESEITRNVVRKEALNLSSKALYSELTGRSYDTNQFKQL